MRVSFDIPEYTFDITGAGTLRLLEAIRESGVEPRFYQAASSRDVRLDAAAAVGATPFHPRSPVRGRQAGGATGWRSTTARRTGCTCATESSSTTSRRGAGETFVTRKITRAVARIKAGLQEKLYLGNLDAKRDWGYAPDYMRRDGHMIQPRRARRLRDRNRREALGARVPRRWPSSPLASDHGSPTSRSIPGTSGPPRSTRSAAMRPRPGASSAGSPRVGFEELVRIMVEADMRTLERRSSRGGWSATATRRTSERHADRRRSGTARRSSSPAARASSADRPCELLERPRAPRCGCRDRPSTTSATADAARDALAGAEVVVHLAATVGGIGFNRRNPGPLAYDNLLWATNVFEAARRRRGPQARRRLLGLRVSAAHPGPVPRGRHLERLPGGVQRSLRACEEDAARPLRRLSAAVRLRLLRPGDRQPLRARRQLRPRGLTRDRGDGPKVLRGG